MDRLDNNSYRDRAGNNLLSITEVGLYDKLHKMSSNVWLIITFSIDFAQSIDFHFHLGSWSK
jgi:hypothetical protein